MTYMFFLNTNISSLKRKMTNVQHQLMWIKGLFPVNEHTHVPLK